MNRLAIFHYHLFPGGVTGVLSNAVTALLSSETGIRDIVLVTGREEHTDAFLETIRSRLNRNRERITVEVVPELDYLHAASGYFENPDGRRAMESGLEGLLLDRYSDRDVWWIHNYHLGKNPLFTNAVLSVIENRADPRAAALKFILQIHDFPECARFDNLAVLERFVTRSAYPVNPRVRYALINERDRNYCRSAGIPESMTVLLDNPVPDTPTPEDRIRARERFLRRLDSFSDKAPGFDRSGPIFLYPVRSIRRKNVLETILLSRLAGDGTNLVVTLPGVSPQEKGYSDLVRRAFEEGLIRGLFGTGDEENPHNIPLPVCVAASDLIVSGSVQEGFGYLFIDAVRWGKPLFARRLETLTGIVPSLEGHPHHLYDTLLVPLDSKLRAETVEAYDRKLKSLVRRFDAAALENLTASVRRLFESDAVDFSYLSPELQYRFLKELSEPAVMKKCRELNATPIGVLHDLLRTPVSYGTTSGHAEDISRRYGKKAFATAFRTVIESFNGERKDPDTPHALLPGSEEDAVSRKLRHLFLRKENFRLLFD